MKQLNMSKSPSQKLSGTLSTLALFAGFACALLNSGCANQQQQQPYPYNCNPYGTPGYAAAPYAQQPYNAYPYGQAIMPSQGAYPQQPMYQQPGVVVPQPMVGR